MIEQEITIHKNRNGYVYTIKGSTKADGEYICKNTEEYEMLEKLGEILLGEKIKVVRK